MTIYVSAGEASGDAYGAALIAEMQRLAGSNVAFRTLANGGKRLGAVCDELVADTGRWGAISITQAIKVFPRIVLSTPRIRRSLRRSSEGADLVVPIDFGFFNARFARLAHRQGWKVLAFIPPGSWRRDRQAKWAPEIYDAVSTPFPWSAEILRSMGTPEVHWFGHPLKQLLRDRLAGGPPDRANQIAVLPGSRMHEMATNLPVIARALPDLPAEFALSAGTDEAKFLRWWRRIAPGRQDKVTVGDSAGVLLRSRAALVCSGTATLEAALCRCPLTVLYATSRMMLFEAWLLRIKRPTYIALPNILLGRRAVDEFVGKEVVSDAIASSLAAVIAEGPTRAAQLQAFDELDDCLGPDDAITRTARLALDVLGV